ncbi:MAG: type IIA DNA topoisomerase subunit B [Bacteroidetes bacterium]|nr:type IIA DNA topoisomerase subunit B [Bacteroidota bacterium]
MADLINPGEPRYTEDEIRSLDWKEHIRLRPGMYIGKLGDGTAADDGIYVLVKEVVDNSIDEHVMGNGKKIEITVDDRRVQIRDYGRGIPLGKVIDCVSKINTGGKYDSRAFQKSVGLNGVGTKAVNALSSYFCVQSFRDGKTKKAEFSMGELVQDHPEMESKQSNGTLIIFEPDNTVFKNFRFIHEYLQEQVKNYTYLNAGLSIHYNGEAYSSKRGLLDLLEHKVNTEELLYPVVHAKGTDFEIAFSHTDSYGEEYYSFVNGQYTTQGGTHLVAFREALVKTVREFYKKEFEATDIRSSVVAAISLRVQEPVFESQTKTKLGSTDMGPDGPTVKAGVLEFVKKHVDDYLHKNPQTADALLKKIMQNERERKDMAGVQKLARERAKRANLHNKKLRDCRVHLTDEKSDKRFDTTLFITEGDSASGSITKSRNSETQAVFSLRGKPLNCYGMKKKVVYENEEFNLLQHALNIEESLENLRYNRIVLATDADVDGMHIRLLAMTFFLQFFPDLVRNGHLYILQTPLFRVRNKKETIYCYSHDEKLHAIQKLGAKPEITRFKGLGEISPDEFGHFIGTDIRLEPVVLKADSSIEKVLSYYMGKNTPERQEFIIDNLVVEKDTVEEINKETEELVA